MKPYEKYRDSGVEWIGEVPEHWRLERLKYCLELVNDKVDDNSLKKVALENIESGTGKYAETSSEFLGEGVAFKKGDILFGKLRPYLAKVLQAEFDGKAVGDIFVYRPSNEITSSFAKYRMLSREFINIVDGSTFGAKMPRASSELVANLPFAYPPLEEQQHIAAYLDRRTAQIDDLISKKRRMIALLKEERAAVINRAVTKGLDPAVKMKESGVEWIGEVPEHWEIKTIARISDKITNGYVGPTRDILQESGVRYLQSLHIKNNEIIFHKPYYVSKEWSDNHPRSILREGDVLIVQTGDIGQVAHVSAEFAGSNCHALILVSASARFCLGEYLSWLLNSRYGFHALKSIQTGALHPHLNSGNVKYLRLPLPPIGEQKEILEYIKEKTSQIDTTISKAERQIGLLQEYRTALISEVVTGKVDVRGEGATG